MNTKWNGEKEESEYIYFWRSPLNTSLLTFPTVHVYMSTFNALHFHSMCITIYSSWCIPGFLIPFPSHLNFSLSLPSFTSHVTSFLSPTLISILSNFFFILHSLHIYSSPSIDIYTVQVTKLCTYCITSHIFAKKKRKFYAQVLTCLCFISIINFFSSTQCLRL